MKKQKRFAGILLHPTSLPGPYGVGDLGPAVDVFLDGLAAAGQSIWQVLPLAPPSYSGSPYDALSAFAGNPLLISPELLYEDGLLDGWELEEFPGFSLDKVDFDAVRPWKEALLRRTWGRLADRRPDLREEMAAFHQDPEQQGWLGDWTLFSALKSRYDGRAWVDWEPGLRRRQRAAMASARQELSDEIAYHEYLQFQFFRQWGRVREMASERDIRIMGDIPIYVSHDSADVWAHPELFDIDSEGHPIHVAGVPPDYFSKTGQRWGNPLYRWDYLADTGYAWWIDRLRANLRLADLVRLDHFRGFAAYWKIDAVEETAINGTWEDGPGKALFDAIEGALGSLPLVAEDLGEITDEVHALRDALGLPGMRVLQFGFGEPDSIHAPHHLSTDTIVYTGTHDNDTLVGWYQSLDDGMRHKVRTYLGADDGGVPWGVIRQAYTSVSELAIVPVQDLLGLPAEARMNTPGEPSGNWQWRLRDGEWTRDKIERLRRLTELSDRLKPVEEDEAAEDS